MDHRAFRLFLCAVSSSISFIKQHLFSESPVTSGVWWNTLRWKRERGSLALAFVFSVMVALAVTLTFVNLVRYVGATNAVSQAARHTARCITPTDPECMSYSGTVGQVMVDWYGYRNNPPEPDAFYVDKYLYRATMYDQTWEQRFDTYQIHKVLPQLTYGRYTVPLKTFERPLNQRERIYYTLKGCVRRPGSFRPEADYPFPHFLRTYEDAHKSGPIGGWQAYCLSGSGDSTCCTSYGSCGQEGSNCNIANIGAVESLNWQVFSLDNDVILNSGHSSEEFETTEDIHVDVIPGADASSQCNSQYGTCSEVISQATGGHGRWWEAARVAIKPFSRVCNDSSSQTASVTWDKLEIKVFNSDGSHYQQSGHEWPRDLGGRSPDNIAPGECNDFHLVLRGPKNSNGGGDCGDHQNIIVPRGGWFRVNSVLRRNQGTVRVDLVRYKVYYDNYIEDQPAETRGDGDCTSGGSGPAQYLQQSPLDPIDGPAAVSDCGYNASEGWVWNSPPYLVQTTTRVPTCDANPIDTFPIEAGEPTADQKLVAVCESGWVPPSGIVPPPDRIYCGSWSDLSGDGAPRIAVGKLNGACNLAQLTAGGPITCSADATYRESGDYDADFPNYYDCSPEVGSTVNAVNASTQQANAINAPFSGAPSFLTLSVPNDFSWAVAQEFAPPKWEFAWRSAGGSGVMCDCSSRGAPGCSVVTCLAPLRPTNTVPIYRHKADSGWQIDASYFPQFESHSGDLHLPPPEGGPDNLTYSSGPIVEVAVQVQGESFNNPVLVSHWGDDTDSGRFDYDGDCVNDSECAEGHHDYESFEQWLRAAATADIAEAADVNLVFDYTSEYNATMEFASEEEFQGLHPPTCAKLRSFCPVDPDPTTFAFLGTFPHSTYPEGPPACSDGSYDECESHVVTDTIEEEAPLGQLNETLARAKGCKELNRFDPTIPSDNCNNILINSSSGEMASVQVSYNMALTPPLNLFLGADYLPINDSVAEPMENKIAGRQAEQ